MQFMMIVKASAESEAGVMPTERELAEMGGFNEEMAKAGVMLSGEGLLASSAGARVELANGAPTVVAGPFENPESLVAGFWIIETATREEAIDWARRVPFRDGEIEVRRVYQDDDLGEEFTPEMREAKRRREESVKR
jgi:hypothetical protein